MPIPNNPLRYVLVYAFETDRGPYLVDAGWNTDDAYNTLVSGLAEAGFAIGDVQGVLVTHIHPDHYGLAGRIREASGAWIGLHPSDAALIEARYDEPDDLLEKMGAMLRRDGAPADEIAGLQNASMPARNWVWAVTPDVLVEDGDTPEVPGWDLTAIWTPGHSPGHICLYESGHRLMLSGDHVLPRITPNISFHPQAGPDPLGDFLASLDKVATFDVAEALPGPRVPLRRSPGAGRRAEGPSPRPLRRGGGRHPVRHHLGVGHRQPHDLEPAMGADPGLDAAGRGGGDARPPAIPAKAGDRSRDRRGAGGLADRRSGHPGLSRAGTTSG